MPASTAAQTPPGPRLLALRARSAGGLRALQSSICHHLDAAGEPLNDDHLHTLNLHRTEFKPCRSGFVADDLARLEAALRRDDAVPLEEPRFPAVHATQEEPSEPPTAPPLGHDWPEPTGELKRWYLTARLLDHWLAQGNDLPAAPGQPAQAEALQRFWRDAGEQLGLAQPLAPVAPVPQGDWRLAVARQLMARYCAGEPLQWRWLSTGRKVSISSHPFDRKRSWFEPAAQREPAELAP